MKCKQCGNHQAGDWCRAGREPIIEDCEDCDKFLPLPSGRRVGRFKMPSIMWPGRFRLITERLDNILSYDGESRVMVAEGEMFDIVAPEDAIPEYRLSVVGNDTEFVRAAAVTTVYVRVVLRQGITVRSSHVEEDVEAGKRTLLYKFPGAMIVDYP